MHQQYFTNDMESYCQNFNYYNHLRIFSWY